MLGRALLAALIVAGCEAGSTHDAPLTASQTASSAGGSTSIGQGGAGQGGGLGGGFGSGGFVPVPVKDLPGLVSITFYERTGGDAPTPYEFAVGGPELTAKLPDPMSDTSRDIPGAPSEFYDVYYSDQAGNFQLDGSYLTISGVYEHPLPAGGGLNLAEIGINYSDTGTEYGNYVASYVALGDNAVPADVGNCIDTDLQTHTTMGNTVGASERLRLTLGFESTSGPPPE